jgi:hypothetical protein
MHWRKEASDNVVLSYPVEIVSGQFCGRKERRAMSTTKISQEDKGCMRREK